MENNETFIIDEETVRRIGLQRSDKQINAQLAPNSRIFEYPSLEDVFIMESDLYGNPMPEGSCFLAFYGRNGLIGKHLKIEKLKNYSVEEIREIVRSNTDGWWKI